MTWYPPDDLNRGVLGAPNASADEFAPSAHGWLPGLRGKQPHAHALPTGKLSPDVIIEPDSRRPRLREGAH